jgi:radical SAM family RiPP maturation amino acid epimerase
MNRSAPLEPIGALPDIFQGYDREEIEAISQVKRLLERYQGDPGFREGTRDSLSTRRQILSDAGIALQPDDFGPLWDHLEDPRSHPISRNDLGSYPALRLWAEWQRQFQQQLQDLGDEHGRSHNKRFRAWRRRAIRRFTDEVNPRPLTVFPLFLYELSKGCSVGCWFCGLSAARFEGVFEYNADNARKWRAILHAGRDVFGDACRDTFCFHGTEPFDNPGYLNFVKDVVDVCGVCPQTTTATPMRDPELTRGLLELRANHPTITDRFSVLSSRTLREVHGTFSPYELRYVELVLHNKGALTYKTRCGRARDRPGKLQRANEHVAAYDPAERPFDPLSIACACGFVVNLVDQTTRLVSPCTASDRWPDGYRVHSEASFADVTEYRAVLEQTAQEHMPEKLDWSTPLVFRSDLEYQRVPDGFTITSRVRRHSLKGRDWYGEFGDLVNAGGSSAGQLITDIAAGGTPLPAVQRAVDDLFNKGLLEHES